MAACTPVTPDQHYADLTPDIVGFALIDADGNIIDQVGTSVAAVYYKGTPLTPIIAGTVDQSYERRLGGGFGHCQDTNDNSADFQLLIPSAPEGSNCPFTPCLLPCVPPPEPIAPLIDLSSMPAAVTALVYAFNW